MEAVANTRSNAMVATAAKALVEAHAGPRMELATAGLDRQGLAGVPGAVGKAGKRAREEEDGRHEASSGSSSCTCDVAGTTDDAVSSKPSPTFPSKLLRLSLSPLQHTSSEVTTETCIAMHTPTPPSTSGHCWDVSMVTPPRKTPFGYGYADGVVLECPGAPIKQRRQTPHSSPSRLASLMRPLNFSVCT